jgi:predicted Zn-dependent protease
MAEYALLAGRWSEAIYHAGKAIQGLKMGSPMELRMEDVKSQAEIARDKEKRNH